MLTPNPTYRPSAAEALQIVNNWYTLGEVPLNVTFSLCRKRRGEGERKKGGKNRNKPCSIAEWLISMATFPWRN